MKNLTYYTHHSDIAGLTGSACGFSVSFQLEEFITKISLPSERWTCLCLCSLICQHMWISKYYYWRSLYCCYISLCEINQTIGKYVSFYLQKLTLNLKFFLMACALCNAQWHMHVVHRVEIDQYILSLTLMIKKGNCIFLPIHWSDQSLSCAPRRISGKPAANFV